MIKEYLKIIALVLVIICSKSSDYAQPKWTTLSGLPESTEIVGACAINGKIYCISTDWWAYSKPRSIYEYDPAIDTWTKKSDMPGKRAGFITACVNNKIYAIGGHISQNTFSNEVNEYDPATDKWTIKHNMPTRRGDGIPSVVFDNKIYIVGGGVGASPTGAVEVYDPANDEWTSYKSLPTPRAFMTVIVSQNKLFIINGFPKDWGDSSGPATITEVLNLQTNKYAADSIPAFPRQVMETPYSSLIQNKYYLFCDYGGVSVNKLLEFDLSTENLSYKKDMSTIRYGFPEIVVNDRIYIVGGVINTSGTLTNKVEYYNPLTDTWTSIANLSSAKSPTLVSIGSKIYAINTSDKSLEVYDTKDDLATGVRMGNRLETFSLSQNYPNPFNPETVISYQLPATSLVQLKVFDMLGREVSTLVEQEQPAGNYQVKFNGNNFSSGVYTYTLKTNEFTQSKKMILIR